MAPAHQRLAAGDPVVLQAETRLVIDLEAAIGDGLAQVDFQHAAGADLRVHVGLEEAIGAAAGGLGGVHRQIGVLQDLVEVGAVLRRQRDADAGVGGDLMAEAFVGRADRLVDAVDELGDVGAVLTPVCTMANSSPPSRATKSVSPTQRPRLTRDRFQQFVADHVAERVVDALEFVDVDVEHRELPAGRDCASSRLSCSWNSARFGRSVSAS